MVSFSCDSCQNVFTKPKVERHFQSCRTRSVSCIDCSAVFDSRSVRAHISCITEDQKFGPKGDACTQSFCGICKLKLNGAVHAVQHYDSKKHRAAIRRRKNEPGNDESVGQLKEGAKDDGMEDETKKAVKEDVETKKDKKAKGLTKVIRKALLASKKQQLKKKGLLKAVTGMLGEKAPQDLEKLVEKKLKKSKRFVVRNSHVMLTESTGRA